MTTIGEQLIETLQTIIDASRTTIRSLITPVYNVSGYPSVQEAVTAANGVGMVYIPYGVHEVDPLATPANTYIFGPGTLKLKAGATDHMITPSGKLTIEGVTLDGNKANQTMDAGSGPDLIHSAYQVIARRVTFKDGKRYGLYVEGGDDTIVDHCFATGMQNTVWFLKSVNRPKVRNNHNDNTCTGHIIALYDLCHDGVVQGNTIRTTAADKFGVELWTNTGQWPTGNMITGNTINGHNLGGGISLSGAQECIVANNRIRDCISIGSIELAQGASGNIVEGNTIENSYRIAVTGTDALRLSRNVVRGNRFKNPIKNGASGGQGIYLLKADDCVIDGNEIAGALGHTIELSDSHRNRLHHNVLVGGALSGFYLGNSNGNFIEYNHIEGFTTAGRYAFQLTLASETPLNHIRHNSGQNNASWISAYTETEVIDNTPDVESPVVGQVTLAASTVTQVNNGNVTGKSKIFITPANSAAAALAGVYVAELVTGSYFNLKHPAATGTEVFNYEIR